MNRRDLIQKFLLGGTVLFVAPSVLTSCSKDDNDDDPGPEPKPGNVLEVDLTRPENAVLNNAGGSRIVQSILIINTGNGFIGLTSVCTHEGCTVGYNQGLNKIQCPCHGSEYSVTGAVTQGPATQSLRNYSVIRSGDVLKITL